jgi:hypothetical protein
MTMKKTTPFGSHESMVCDNMLQDTVLGVNRILAGAVLLKDDSGYYVTERKRLDDGLADPNRYSSAAARAI